MMMRQMFDAKSSTFTYLLASGGQALLIDPVLEQCERDLKLIGELGLALTYVLDTHTHADHITAAGKLRERTTAKTVTGCRGAECVDVRLEHGAVIRLGDDIELRVLETPGHTDDSVCYYDARLGHLFSGDTLLIRGNGRSDFQNGSAEQLFDSLTRVLFALPDDTVVWPAHDYTGMTCSTIGEEKRLNPRIAGKTRSEFVTIMNDLRLPRPKLIDQAVPANRACGQPKV